MKLEIFDRILFVLVLFVFTVIPSVELSLIISVLILLYVAMINDIKLDGYLFNLLTLLSLIFLIGLLSGFFYNHNRADILRDIAHFLKPIATMLAGYVLVKKIDNARFVIKSIILVAVLVATWHLLKVMHLLLFSGFEIDKLRYKAGLGNFLELLALIFLIASKKYKLFEVINKGINKRIIFSILMASFIFYFSRTMLLGLILISLAVYGRTKLNAKGLKYSLILISAIFITYAILLNLKLDPDKPGLQSFFYKIRNAPSEVFSSPENYNPKDHKRIFDRWRAYEAKMALEQMKGNYLFGKGFGSLVDLKFVAPLNENGMRYIPITHNGYVYIFFKTGIFGILLYGVFLISLYAQSYKPSFSRNEQAIRNLISGFGIYYILTSLIITGIYNLEELLSFILGVILCLLANSRVNYKTEG